jgi:hypothetical protein
MTTSGSSVGSGGAGPPRRRWFSWLLRGQLADTLREQQQALPYLGFRIFKWLLALVLLLLFGLAVVGWRTYPERVQFVPDIAKATPDQWNALAAARAAWVAQLKDLSQAFIFAPVFPLLGAVVGYIFGREGVRNGSAPEVAQGKASSETAAG